jgi:hypothetical protein
LFAIDPGNRVSSSAFEGNRQGDSADGQRDLIRDERALIERDPRTDKNSLRSILIDDGPVAQVSRSQRTTPRLPCVMHGAKIPFGVHILREVNGYTEVAAISGRRGDTWRNEAAGESLGNRLVVNFTGLSNATATTRLPLGLL